MVFVMKVLAFAASNSQSSINRALVNFAIDRLLQDAETKLQIDTLDLNDFEMPIYSIDRENEMGIPPSAHEFFNKIGEVDALLISFAEHNGSTSAAWKNIFDWMSRIEMKVWQSKPLVMLAATPGRRAGAGVLDRQAALAPHFGAVLNGQLGIGNWQTSWNPTENRLSQEADIEALDNVLSVFKHDA